MKYDDRVIFEYFDTGKTGLHGSDVLLDGECIAAMYEKLSNILVPIDVYYTKKLDWSKEAERLCEKYGCGYEVNETSINTIWRGFEKLEELIDFHIECFLVSY